MSDDDRSKWDSRYRAAAGESRAPSPFLVSLDALLPRGGRALDLAGGAGRNAVWLAQLGLDVTIADVSPVGLALAAEEARRLGVPLTTRALDVDRDPFPEGPWALIICFHFLHRPLFPALLPALAPGGLLVIAHPTLENLTRHPSPSARFLLENGELPGLCAGLTIVSFDEAFREDGRHEARIVARRPLS